MGYPPPDLITNEIEDETCWWADDDADCHQKSVTTRYDDFRREWVPVCDDHRR